LREYCDYCLTISASAISLYGKFEFEEMISHSQHRYYYYYGPLSAGRDGRAVGCCE